MSDTGERFFKGGVYGTEEEIVRVLNGRILHEQWEHAVGNGLLGRPLVHLAVQEPHDAGGVFAMLTKKLEPEETAVLIGFEQGCPGHFDMRTIDRPESLGKAFDDYHGGSGTLHAYAVPTPEITDFLAQSGLWEDPQAVRVRFWPNAS